MLDRPRVPPRTASRLPVSAAAPRGQASAEPAAGPGAHPRRHPPARPAGPARPPRPVGGDGGRAEPSTVFLAASYVFGVVGGFLLGVYGVLLVPAGPRVGGTLLSVGLALAVVGNTALAVFVRWLTGTRMGALIPLVGWTPVVGLMGSSRVEGDLLLRSTATGYLFLALGVLMPIVVAVLGRARRGLTALPPMR